MGIAGHNREAEMYYSLEQFVKANLPITAVDPKDLAEKEMIDEVARRVQFVVDNEAPIYKDAVEHIVLQSFAVKRSATTRKAIEKAYKKANIKTCKTKGETICWRDDQNPETYSAFRTNPERSSEEIPQVEAKNALCYVLQEYGAMSEDDAFKTASLILGYKKLGPNLKKVLKSALKSAEAGNEIKSDGDHISLTRAFVPAPQPVATAAPEQETMPFPAVEKPKPKKGRLKIVLIAIAALIGFSVLSNTIKSSAAAKIVQETRNEILSSFDDPIELSFRNFGALDVRVLAAWSIIDTLDDSEKAEGSYKDPITSIHREMYDDKGALIAAEDIRYLGEEEAGSTTSRDIAGKLADSLGVKTLNESGEDAVFERVDAAIDEGTFTYTNNGQPYRIETVIVNLAESYYAISGVFSEKYYSDELFPALLDNIGLMDYVPAHLTSLEIAYDGTTRIGAKLSERSAGFSAEAVFDNGITRDVKDDVEIAGDKDGLKLGETTVYEISYTYNGTTKKESLPITCTSEYSMLKVYYNGPTVRGTKVDDLSNFTVNAVYTTPGEADTELDVTGKCTLANPGTLEANRSREFGVKYGEESASYNVQCSTKMTLEVDYTGSNSEGTVIDDLDGFVVTAVYSDDTYKDGNVREDVTSQASLNHTATLSGGRNETFVISYDGAEAQCTIECPPTRADPGEPLYDYIGNRNTRKFHYPWCRSVNQMKESNKVYFYGVTRQEMINRGYDPCKNCNP